VPPLTAALLAAVAIHGAWLLSRAAGYVPDCIPHFEGCTSVSRAARHGAANALFKALMIPNAFVQAWTWAVAARWVAARSVPGADRGLVPLGIVAAVALAVYAAALGTEGVLYNWLRRYGINFYFAATFCAMLVFVRQLRQLESLAVLPKVLLWTCAAMLLLGMSNVLAPLLGVDAETRERFRDALEWQLTTLFTAWFILQAALFRRAPSVPTGRIRAGP
jgi:hypothetical protein